MMEPTIDQLRLYCAVVEEKSFVQAAVRQYVSQPHVSRSVKDLERRVGTDLLVRSPKGVIPTPTGQLMYEEAIRIIQTFEHAFHRIQMSRNTAHETLTIGFNTSTSTRLIADITRQFEKTHPNVQLRFREAHSAEQERQLAAGDLDIGILHPPISLINATTVPLYTEQCVAIAPADFDEPGPIALGRFAKLPLVVYQQHLGGIPVIIANAFEMAGVKPNIVADAPGTRGLLESVRSGTGLAITTVSTLESQLAEDRIFDIVNPTISCTVALAYFDSRSTAALKDFVDIAIRVTENLTDLTDPNRPLLPDRRSYGRERRSAIAFRDS